MDKNRQQGQQSQEGQKTQQSQKPNQGRQDSDVRRTESGAGSSTDERVTERRQERQ